MSQPAEDDLRNRPIERQPVPPGHWERFNNWVYRPVLRDAVMWQLFFTFLMGLLSRPSGRGWLLAMVLFWGVAGLVIRRNPSNPSVLQKEFVRYGFLLFSPLLQA